MKVDLYVLGVYRGQIDVAEESIVGSLARAQFDAAMHSIADLQSELQQITADMAEGQEEK